MDARRGVAGAAASTANPAAGAAQYESGDQDLWREERERVLGGAPGVPDPSSTRSAHHSQLGPKRGVGQPPSPSCQPPRQMGSAVQYSLLV